MSMIIGTISPQLAVLSGDQRAVDHNGIIYSENFHKIFKVNSNTLIGFTGDSTPATYLKEHGYLSQPDKIDAKEFSNYLFGQIGGGGLNANTNILIIGKTKNNNGWVTVFNSKDANPSLQREFITDAMVVPFPPSGSSKSADDLAQEYNPRVGQIFSSVNSIEEGISKISEFQIARIKEFALSFNNVNQIVETYSIKF